MRESQKKEAQEAYAQLWLRDAFPVDGTTMGYVCFSLFKSISTETISFSSALKFVARTKRRHSSPARCKLDLQDFMQERLRLGCGRRENVRLVIYRSRGSNPSPASTF